MHTTVDNPLSADELDRLWTALLRDPDAPERFELDEFGEIIVSPAPSNKHQIVVLSLLKQIEAQLGGEAGMPSVRTPTAGIRSPDLAWMGDAEAWRRLAREDPMPVVPDLCIEVVSPGNRRKDLNEKVAGYLAGGAKEVVLVETDGRIRYFHQDGEHPQSRLGLELTLPPDTYPL
jgi:Uma2 family endonuclease